MRCSQVVAVLRCKVVSKRFRTTLVCSKTPRLGAFILGCSNVGLRVNSRVSGPSPTGSRRRSLQGRIHGDPETRLLFTKQPGQN